MSFDLQKSAGGRNQHPLSQLPDEDLELVMRLVLASGSLKDLATTYGVSYPTVRLRVDRVIERLNAVLAGRKADPYSQALARLVERGEMSPAAARELRELHRALTSNASGIPGAESKE